MMKMKFNSNFVVSAILLSCGIILPCVAEDIGLIPDFLAPKNEQLQAPNILANKQVDAAAKLSNVLMPGPVMPDEKIAQNLRAPEDRKNDITNNNNMYNEGKVSLVGAVDPNIKPSVSDGMGGEVIKAKIPETDNTGAAVNREVDRKAADEQDEQIRDRIDQDANTDVVNKGNKVDNDDDGGDDDGSDVNDDSKSSDLEKGYDSDFKGSGTTEDDKEDEDDTGDSNDDGDTGDSNDDVKEDKNDSDSDGTDENTDDDTTEDNDDDNDGDDDDDMKDNNVYDDDRMDNNDDDDDTEDSDDSKGDVEGSSTENPLRLIQEDLNRKVQDDYDYDDKDSKKIENFKYNDEDESSESSEDANDDFFGRKVVNNNVGFDSRLYGTEPTISVYSWILFFFLLFMTLSFFVFWNRHWVCGRPRSVHYRGQEGKSLLAHEFV